MTIFIDMNKDILNEMVQLLPSADSVHENQQCISSLLFEHNGRETRITSANHKIVAVTILNHPDQVYIEPIRLLLDGEEMRAAFKIIEEYDKGLDPSKVKPTVWLNYASNMSSLMMRYYNYGWFFRHIYEVGSRYPDFTDLFPEMYNQELGFGITFSKLLNDNDTVVKRQREIATRLDS